MRQQYRHLVWYTSSKQLILMSPTLSSERIHIYVSRHNLNKSFKSSDCNLWACFKIFEPKFANASTKCKSVIVNCIAPMISAELLQELDKVNCVSVTVGGSNRKEQGPRRAGTLPLLFHKGYNGGGDAFS